MPQRTKTVSRKKYLSTFKNIRVMKDFF